MIRSMGFLLASLLASAGASIACSPSELAQKQKAYADAVKAAYDRDPAGDPARQARVKEVLERYKDVGKMTNGPAILDMICKENDELTMIYK